MSKSLNFTKTALEGLVPPESGRDTFYDRGGRDSVPGLQLRVTSNGVKTFSVLRRVPGSTPVRVNIGRFGVVTVEKARAEAKRINAEIASGENRAAVKRALKAEPTFGEVFEDFIENRLNKAGRHLSDRTKAEYRAGFRLYLGEMKNRKLSAIDREDVARLHRKIGVDAKTQANRIKALVSSVFGYAILRGWYAGQNPTIGIQSYAERSRDRFVQPDELPAFFAAVAAESNGALRDFILLALLTGARRSNVLAMRWTDLRLDEAVWRIPKTKNGEPQNVVLSAEAVEILLARREAAEDDAVFVFPGEGKAGHLSDPKKGWARVLARAGLADLRIHDLRRTLGSWQAKTGASLAIIGKSLNHKTHQATAIYARLDLDPVRHSVTTATSAILEAAGVKETAEILAPRRKV